MGPSKFLIQDPLRFGLKEILTVAQMMRQLRCFVQYVSGLAFQPQTDARLKPLKHQMYNHKEPIKTIFLLEV